MMAGYNMPDGVSETSTSAPWNRPDPWSGRTCGDCRNATDCRMLDGTKRLVCVDALAVEAIEVDPREAACEAFEGR